MDCPDCASKVGELHKSNCDVERCPFCGGQALQCLHGGEDSLICENTGLKVKQEDLLPWMGGWPGEAEVEEYGFWCKMVGGIWVECFKDDPEAKPDLNRLCVECVWDREKKKFVREVSNEV